MHTEWLAEDTEMDSGSPLLTHNQSTELEVCQGCFHYAIIAQ